MTLNGWIQIAIYCAIVVALVKPLGWYMTRVFDGERTFLSPVLRLVERGLYWLGGVDETRSHDAGRARGGQYGRSRLESNQAH
jgi:potassium-transporting ATPase potassium-binding subunit